jgi:sulfur-oxidizing protein SoxZ
MSTPRVRIPASASAGDVIEVRTLIDHPMVTALSSAGPRDMLERFEATRNGETVFAFEFGNGSAANPTFTFHVRVEETSDFVFTWTHEDGSSFVAEETVQVG